MTPDERAKFRREAALQLAVAEMSNAWYTEQMWIAAQGGEKIKSIPEHAIDMADKLLEGLGE